AQTGGKNRGDVTFQGRKIEFDEPKITARRRLYGEPLRRDARLFYVAGGANDLSAMSNKDTRGFRPDTSRHASDQHPKPA
ncbi:hypothetical protein, partial [Sphingomonas sp. PAMC 26605]|uniref:hypothetical protein n=1 Tax=Sphingomonas sp. PAMC 26605 TaxID=1112214 RepID=UPI001E3A4698